MLAWMITSGVSVALVLLIHRIFKGRICLRLQYALWLPVYMVSGLPSPCLFGLLHPAIYLPEGITREQLTYVLAHEESHYRITAGQPDTERGF